MEIISVTRGDHPSDPWRLSPSIKGMLPFRPACLIAITSEVQGECRVELARAMLSRSLHSPSQPACDGKGTTFQNATFRLGKTRRQGTIKWIRHDLAG